MKIYKKALDIADNAGYIYLRKRLNMGVLLKYNFSLVLVKETPDEEGVLTDIQSIDFYGSRFQADKVFFALSFALCRSEYSVLYLFQGEQKIKSTTFKH